MEKVPALHRIAFDVAPRQCQSQDQTNRYALSSSAIRLGRSLRDQRSRSLSAPKAGSNLVVTDSLVLVIEAILCRHRTAFPIGNRSTIICQVLARCRTLGAIRRRLYARMGFAPPKRASSFLPDRGGIESAVFLASSPLVPTERCRRQRRVLRRFISRLRVRPYLDNAQRKGA